MNRFHWEKKKVSISKNRNITRSAGGLDDLVVGHIRIGDRRSVVGPRDRNVHVARGLVLEMPGERGHAADIEVVYPLRRRRGLGVAEPVLVGRYV